MNQILNLGHNDVRLFLKKKSGYAWLFVVPLIFMYILGAANRAPGDPGNRQPRVLIDNEDRDFLGKILAEELGQGIQKANRSHAAVIVRIPSDFSSRLLRGEQSNVQLEKGENANEADDAITKLHVMRVTETLDGYIEQAKTDKSAQPVNEERLRAIMAKRPAVTLETRFAGRQPVPSGFNFSLPANLLMYLMMNLLIFGGLSVAAERRNGVIRRLLSNPLSRGEIILGKIYGLMLLAVVQIVFFLAVGKFAMGVNLGANLFGVLLTLLIYAWVAGSLGVLAGSLLAAEDRVVGVCVLASLLMASLGGCWWPLEVAPPAARLMALFMPTGWALRALNQLISFGNGLETVVLPLIVLIGFGVAANCLAARFFKS